MMTYAAAALAEFRVGATNHICVTPFLVEAENFDEATGKAVRIAAIIYPAGEGWQVRYAGANGKRLTPETAIVESKPWEARS